MGHLNIGQVIIETFQRQAYHAVDTILSQRNWLIGYRIAEEEIDGSERAEYGANIIKKLSKEISVQYGKGCDRSNLYHCLCFYKEIPQIVDKLIYGFRGRISIMKCFVLIDLQTGKSLYQNIYFYIQEGRKYDNR